MDCDLESALTVKHLTDGQFTSYAPPDYESHNGMFGGWTTAVALHALALEDVRALWDIPHSCGVAPQERVTLSMMVRSARLRFWRSSLVRPLKRRASNSRT